MFRQVVSCLMSAVVAVGTVGVSAVEVKAQVTVEGYQTMLRLTNVLCNLTEITGRFWECDEALTKTEIYRQALVIQQANEISYMNSPRRNQSTAGSSTCLINAEDVNLRTGNSTSSAVNNNLDAGAYVTRHSTSRNDIGENWSWVTANGINSWVRTDFLNCSFD